MKTLYESQEKVVNLFNDYSNISSEAKYRTIYEEGHPLDLAYIAHIAKVSDCNFFNHKQLKMLTLKTNTSKITNSTCTSKSRKYIWKLTKWNKTNRIFFVLSK